MQTITPAAIRKAALELKTYDFGRSTEPLETLEQYMQAAPRQAAIRSVLETELIQALGDDYSYAARKFASEKLWTWGGDAALQALEAMMTGPDWKAAEMACYAIGRRPSAKADEAVRAALQKAQGRSLVAVLTLAGERRDPANAGRLAQLGAGSDDRTAEAALAALGKIASPEALAALQKVSGARTRAAHHALLQAAQEVQARGLAREVRETCAFLQKNAAAPHIHRAAAELAAGATSQDRPLFNGRDLSEWIVDTPGIWSVRNGVIVGESPGLPYNEFLRTRASCENFIFQGKLRIIDGVGNSGIQFRSKPVENSHELSGYQADAGERHWGALYDESRRRKVLATPGDRFIDGVDGAAWHSYVVEANENRIRIVFDGVETVDYEEREPGIERQGFIALQVHGSREPVEVWFKDLRIHSL